MTRRLIVPTFLLLAVGPAASQQLPTSPLEPARISPVAAPELPALRVEQPPDLPPLSAGGGVPARAAAQPAKGKGFLSRAGLAHAIGGAIVGGWVGYVGAQVARSDWDKENNGSFTGQRWAWVAGGMVVGLIGSRLIGRNSAPGAASMGPPQLRRNRLIITAQEIERAGANNAYQLIATLRSEWLVPRGANRWSESDQGTADGLRTFVVDITPAQDRIIVYLDDVRLGGVDNLKDLPTGNLRKAEFVDGRRATYLYGAGHAHGVIRLSTAAEAP